MYVIIFFFEGNVHDDLESTSRHAVCIRTTSFFLGVFELFSFLRNEGYSNWAGMGWCVWWQFLGWYEPNPHTPGPGRTLHNFAQGVVDWSRACLCSANQRGAFSPVQHPKPNCRHPHRVPSSSFSQKERESPIVFFPHGTDRETSPAGAEFNS